MGSVTVRSLSEVVSALFMSIIVVIGAEAGAEWARAALPLAQGDSLSIITLRVVSLSTSSLSFMFLKTAFTGCRWEFMAVLCGKSDPSGCLCVGTKAGAAGARAWLSLAQGAARRRARR